MAKQKKRKNKMDTQAMMAAYKMQATPGDPHRLLARMAGSWTIKSMFWMDPQSPLLEANNSCEQEMILGGRYLQQKYTGQMEGEAFTGIGLIGYDNHAKRYVSTWIDTMSTGIYFFEGASSKDGNTLTMKSSSNDPLKGPMKYRQVTRIVDGKTLLMEMYGTRKNGKEEKLSEEIFSRKE